FDVVVLNSVVQYFPSADYLERVLRAAAELLRPGGHIFIGDVRHLGLWEAFHASVEVERAFPDLRRTELKERLSARLRKEPELLGAPEFFAALAGRLPSISAVEAQIKRGRSDNELTRFRYDVVLEIGGQPEPPGRHDELSWSEVGSLPALVQELRRRRP